MERLKRRGGFFSPCRGGGETKPAFFLEKQTRGRRGAVRIGFTVSKKVGTATERNRVRRRLRELVKQAGVLSMRPHSDYVLVGRRGALHRGFAIMLDDLRRALHRLDRPAPERS